MTVATVRSAHQGRARTRPPRALVRSLRDTDAGLLALTLLVGGVKYRNPALHAKITTTIDVISGGRAIHGLGAGWF